MSASAAAMMTIGMVEVIVRNAMDRALQELATKRGWTSWFDQAPLDTRGRADIRKARERATRFGRQREVHGKVVAELPLGFWRYLAASRYLTALWTPALFRAFKHAPFDKRRCQREVERRLQSLLLLRNRAAHHEPIHRRNLGRDLAAAIDVSSWANGEAGDWVRDLSPLTEVIARKPGRAKANVVNDARRSVGVP